MSDEPKTEANVFVPTLFATMAEESRVRLAAAMNDVITHDPNGKNWAVYWAKEFLRALDGTREPATLPLEPMICGCAQGKHEERRHIPQAIPSGVACCKLGWPL